jgi:recombination protein RecA
MTKTVDDLLAEFEKKHGLKTGVPEEVTGLTTGNLAIDWQTGVGGIPVGRITELYGYESSGKTTTALQTAAELQTDIKERESDQRIVYLDFEHALDVDYASGLGIDFGHPSFIPLQPNNLEQGAIAALNLIETGKVPLIVFDSVAAMSPKRLKDGDFDQATIQMHRAKLISALCQSSIDLLHVHKCAAVFINHKMESIEMTGRPGIPPRVTTPGGRGLKYYASLRLEFDVGGGVKAKMDDFLTGEESSQLVGNKVYVKCVKNKVGPPGHTVEIRSRYGQGFDNAWSALQILLSRNLIVKTGTYFHFDTSKVPTLVHPDMGVTLTNRAYLHGEEKFLLFSDQHSEWRDELISVAAEQLNKDEEA